MTARGISDCAATCCTIGARSSPSAKSAAGCCTIASEERKPSSKSVPYSRAKRIMYFKFRSENPLTSGSSFFKSAASRGMNASPPSLFNLTIMDHPPDVPIHGYHLGVSRKRRFRLRRADTRLDPSQKGTVVKKFGTQRPSPAACSASLSASSSRSVPRARPSAKRQGMPESPV